MNLISDPVSKTQPHQTQTLQQSYENIKLVSQFKNLTPPSFDPIHQAIIMFAKDTSPQKINLSVGAYRDQNGNPYVFNVVRKSQEQVLQNLNKEYIYDGYLPFCQAAQQIIFGKDSPAIKENRIATLQTLSGTGALHIGFDFIYHHLPSTPKIIYVSDPTWPTHPDVIELTGLQVKRYPYYDPELKGLNFIKMIEYIQAIEEGSVLLLQNAGHNPTGCDPTKDQWKQLCKVMKVRSLIPFFDPAYQGFASGDLDEDAWPIRYFLEQGFLMFVAQSFAKNLGLYGDRIGALHIVTPDKECAEKTYNKIRSLARKLYLSPPAHGSFIVDKIVNNEERFKQWVVELRQKVSGRVKKARHLLRSQLQRLKTPGTWNHITEQVGMFSFTGLTPRQCEIMIEKYHIYMIKNGRMAVSGVSQSNYKRIAECMKKSIQESFGETV